jgi:hypothetical protein
MGLEDNSKKQLLLSERITQMTGGLKKLTKLDRWQYRTDIKAVMCSGSLNQGEVDRVKKGLWIEDGFFWASRAYVPFRILGLYKLGVFE